MTTPRNRWIEIEGTTYCPFCAAAYRVIARANRTYTPWSPLTDEELSDSGCIDDDGNPLPANCETCGTEYEPTLPKPTAKETR